MDYTEFFAKATSGMAFEPLVPYVYQEAVARDGLPAVLEAPTGTGKTEAITLGWLYRLLESADEIRSQTPRRLIYALPMKVLVEQTQTRVKQILTNLGLANDISVHVLMGGHLRDDSLYRWRCDMHRPAIVIGTVDAVISRALNRGFGCSRGGYPIDFALVTNDAHIVLDEVQLAEQACATLRQIAGFQNQFHTARPVGLTCMSATMRSEVLNVIDNPFDAASTAAIRFDPDQEVSNPELSRRLMATRHIEHAAEVKDAKSLAKRALAEHRPQTRTIVLVNTVDLAIKTVKELHKVKTQADITLVHSRFRGIDRADIISSLNKADAELPLEGNIIVSTQALEAGIDIDAATLITEVAPWSSLVQRAGRCNRRGVYDNARLVWFDSTTKRQPYDEADLEETSQHLAELEGVDVTTSHLGDIAAKQHEPDLAIIRRVDFLNLFDTTPDLAGSDIDISRFIRDDDQRDVQVAWVNAEDWIMGKGEDRTNKQMPRPPERLRCVVPRSQIQKFLKRTATPTVLSFSSMDDGWRRLSPDSRPRPQELLLIDWSSGGYSPEFGFEWENKEPLNPDDGEPTAENAESDMDASFDSDDMGSDPTSQTGEWLTVEQHLDDTGKQAAALVKQLFKDECPSDAIAPTLPEDRYSIIAAAALHDWGKLHADWQEGLIRAVPGSDRPTGGPFAKSPQSAGRHRLIVHYGNTTKPRKGFRHELVSALMLFEPDGVARLAALEVPPSHYALCRYLVAAHHGKIRLQPRDPLSEGSNGTATLLGLDDGEPLLGDAPNGDNSEMSVAGSDAVVDLARFSGGPDSWNRAALELLDHYGPFTLAFYETVVRMADWRASRRDVLPGEEH